MDEFGGGGTATTGRFSGRATGDGWSGSWRSPDGRDLPFALREDRDALPDLDGRLRCRTSFRDGGYTFTDTLDLAAKAGRVTAFALSQDVTGYGERQSCSVALSDLRQVPASAGITLSSKVAPSGPADDAAPQGCSVRFLGDRRTLTVGVDGCKEAGDAMLCSSRGSWSDLVIDRRTRACAAIR